MKTTELIELIYKAMPNSNIISKLDIMETCIYFDWDGYRFRVSDTLMVEEVKNGCLFSNSIASLIEHILKTYNNNRE